MRNRDKLNKALAKFKQANKHYVNAANKGINRGTILSSRDRYKLPSAVPYLRLQTICQEAGKLLEDARKAYAKISEIRTRSTILNHKYRNDPKALAELPHTYLNDKRIRVRARQLDEALALYEAVTIAFKLRTGRDYKPHVSEQVNAPIVIETGE